MIIFDSSDILIMDKMIGIVKRGYYLAGSDVTNLYNKIFQKNLRNTNCGTCIKQRYAELERAYKHFKAELEAQSKKVEEEVKEEVKAVKTPKNKVKKQVKKDGE